MFNVDFTTNESILITTIDIFDIRTHSIFLAILENYNNPKPEILYMSLSIHVFQKKNFFRSNTNPIKWQAIIHY